jgi:hypothetical protein
MSAKYGRLARALLLIGGIATAFALPSIVGTPLMPLDADLSSRVAMAAPAAQNNNEDDDGNDDPTGDNSEERNLEGQVLRLDLDKNPPEALIGVIDGPVLARIYNDQVQRSGIDVGDYVEMKGEYGELGIFDAYEVTVNVDDNDNE